MDTWLLKAAVSGDSNELKKMVSQDPNVNLLGTTPQGSTCLHISSIFGHEEFFKEVLARNESLLSRVNSYGETPLIVSVKSGHISLATTLLEKYKERKLSEVILNSDINGDTALHHAIRHGHKNLALQLIKTEPNLSQRVNNYNESPMYIAVMRGFVDVFKQLWESDRSSHKGPYDDNALHAAVRNANIEIIEAIMKKRPELAKEKNKSGHTPIQYAVDRNQTSVISKMLQHDL
ncbi:Ankyrin repeat family protein [Rhynchospora pubera]|uniref:Ankyrin repeat family protein n=1 Tax=Rhynchospora pubera TaxID=906938 RepID=A0AAV8HT86_9POAL|nr:Ankyrin repeat family protein [Rhynchospora pubera]